MTTADLTVILDDREPCSRDVQETLGQRRFTQILRRRRRLGEELRDMASAADAVVTLETDAQAEALASRIESRGPDAIYVRVPTFATPRNGADFAIAIAKCRYAIENTFVSGILANDAVLALRAKQMASLLRTPDATTRRALLLSFAETMPRFDDGTEIVDLREQRVLLAFLSGATESRAFNQTAVTQDIFKKTSTDKAKMKAEHDFFHVAPPSMMRYFVPTFDYWEDENKAGYSTEYFAIPDVSLKFIHEAFTEASFDALLDCVFRFFSARERTPVTRAEVAQCGQTQIIDKLDARLATLRNMPEYPALAGLLDNRLASGGFEALAAAVRDVLVDALARDQTDHLAFSHGDPCFSNILFDHRLGLMRLIDPRGATTPAAALMHPLYDVAKFSHSVLGEYDLINHDLYDCVVTPDLKLTLTHRMGPTPPWVRQLFLARLGEAKIDLHTVRAIEASLFMSMLPLHRDNPRKLVAFALTAQRILDEIETVK